MSTTPRVVVVHKRRLVALRADPLPHSGLCLDRARPQALSRPCIRRCSVDRPLVRARSQGARMLNPSDWPGYDAWSRGCLSAAGAATLAGLGAAFLSPGRGCTIHLGLLRSSALRRSALGASRISFRARGPGARCSCPQRYAARSVISVTNVIMVSALGGSKRCQAHDSMVTSPCTWAAGGAATRPP